MAAIIKEIYNCNYIIMTEIKSYTDIELIEQYRQSGEGRYVGELYKRHTKMVLVLCCKYLKNKEIAKEAAVQIFENLISYLKKYTIDNFRSWLMSVTRNHCYMMLRNEKGIVEYCDFFERNVDEFVEFEDVFTLSSKEEEEKRFVSLEQAVENLPVEQRECIKLFYLKGNSYSDITGITGYDFKQIKSFLQNGRRNLKKALTQSGISAAMLSVLFIYNY